MMYVLSMLLKYVNLICYIYIRISSVVPSLLKNILCISIKYLKHDVEWKGGGRRSELPHSRFPISYHNYETDDVVLIK